MTSQEHAQHIVHMLLEAQRECRVDSERVADPKAQALFETVAEVFGGTVKALKDYSDQMMLSVILWYTRREGDTGKSRESFNGHAIDAGGFLNRKVLMTNKETEKKPYHKTL